MDNVVVSKILGESSDWNLFLLTKKLARILNSFEGADIEDTSPRPDDEEDPDDGPEYDTSEETDDLQSIRSLIFEWAEEAHNLLPDNKEALKVVDLIVTIVRHYMRHETRDCLYNLSNPWAEFLQDNPKGPQFDYDLDNGKYKAISNSVLHDVLSGNALGDDVED